jgi:hypothetical protein
MTTKERPKLFDRWEDNTEPVSASEGRDHQLLRRRGRVAVEALQIFDRLDLRGRQRLPHESNLFGHVG